jgi:hypothetical protein
MLRILKNAGPAGWGVGCFLLALAVAALSWVVETPKTVYLHSDCQAEACMIEKTAVVFSGSYVRCQTKAVFDNLQGKVAGKETHYWCSYSSDPLDALDNNALNDGPNPTTPNPTTPNPTTPNPTTPNPTTPNPTTPNSTTPNSTTPNPTTPNPTTPASGNWYLHWNCSGDPTCPSTLGSNTGIWLNFDTQGDCQQGLIPFNNLGEAPNAWCDQSSDGAETGPS